MQGLAILPMFLAEIEKLYSHIDLFMINLEKKKRLKLAENIPTNQALKVLEKENAWWKNQKRNENLYFAPSHNQKTFSWLFLDDVNPEKLKSFKAIIVQTSQNKFQAYIKLNKALEAENYKEFARQAVKTFQADKAVIDPYHLRRLPSFFNTKYKKPYMISFYCLYWDKELKLKELEVPPEINTRPPRWKKILIPTKKGGVCLNRKTWDEFYSPSAPSYSEVDFAYACYLLKLGYEPEEVKNILGQESPDLAKRHRNPEDYLDRTVKAALRRI